MPRRRRPRRLLAAGGILLVVAAVGALYSRWERIDCEGFSVEAEDRARTSHPDDSFSQHGTIRSYLRSTVCTGTLQQYPYEPYFIEPKRLGRDYLFGAFYWGGPREGAGVMVHFVRGPRLLFCLNSHVFNCDAAADCECHGADVEPVRRTREGSISADGACDSGKRDDSGGLDR